jgi:Integrase zinc binding domain
LSITGYISWLQQQQVNPQKYPSITLDGIDLICYVTVLGAPWWIDIPETLLDSIIFWYHKILAHIGMTRLYDTISVHFSQSSLNHGIETIIQSCGVCQRIKLSGAGYGHLTPCEALVVLWFEVTVDLMGPKNVTNSFQNIYISSINMHWYNN